MGTNKRKNAPQHRLRQPFGAVSAGDSDAGVIHWGIQAQLAIMAVGFPELIKKAHLGRNKVKLIQRRAKKREKEKERKNKAYAGV